MKENDKDGIILLVDDDELILKPLKTAFEMKGYNVITALCGNRAIKIFNERSEEIRCIVLDKRMSGLDGIQTMKELKKIDKNCVILMMSGCFSIEEEIELNEAAIKIFKKPFSILDMINSLEG